jgi:hypothetical protein
VAHAQVDAPHAVTAEAVDDVLEHRPVADRHQRLRDDCGVRAQTGPEAAGQDDGLPGQINVAVDDPAALGGARSVLRDRAGTVVRKWSEVVLLVVTALRVEHVLPPKSDLAPPYPSTAKP